MSKKSPRKTTSNNANSNKTDGSARDVLPVLIVGAGPVGLGLAAELGSRGIRCMVVERGDGTISHPRANTVNSRTMEYCRRWGIAEAVRQAGTPPEFPSDIVYLSSLPGFEIARIARPSYGGLKPLATTPEQSQRCNQLWFDPIMRELVKSLAPTVELRFGVGFESFVEDAEGVSVTLRDANGKREQLRTRYLAACCGGQSGIPEALGIRMEGIEVVSYNLNVFLRIPELWNHHDKGKAAFYYFIDDPDNESGGFDVNLIELNGADLWRLGINQGTHAVPADQVDIHGLIRRMFGQQFGLHACSDIANLPSFSGVSVGGSGTGDGSGAAGTAGFGEPCQSNADCKSGYCIDGYAGHVCSQTCNGECPIGYSCQKVFSNNKPVQLCVPQVSKICRVCNDDLDCAGGSCVKSGDEQFCAPSCAAGAPRSTTSSLHL